MLTIGKLARVAQISPDALRFYEREGLLEPAGRTASRYRLYDPAAVTRVRFIRHAQTCGFTLPEIRELLALRARSAACCGDVRNHAVEKKLQLEGKIRVLRTMSEALSRLIADCDHDREPVEACPILAAFEQATSVPAVAQPG